MSNEMKKLLEAMSSPNALGDPTVLNENFDDTIADFSIELQQVIASVKDDATREKLVAQYHSCGDDASADDDGRYEAYADMKKCMRAAMKHADSTVVHIGELEEMGQNPEDAFIDEVAWQGVQPGAYVTFDIWGAEGSEYYSATVSPEKTLIDIKHLATF